MDNAIKGVDEMNLFDIHAIEVSSEEKPPSMIYPVPICREENPVGRYGCIDL